MRISIDVWMHYKLAAADTVFYAVEVAQTLGQVVKAQTLEIANAQVNRILGDSGVGTRLCAAIPDQDMQLSYKALVDITRSAVDLPQLNATPVHELPAEAAPYLRPSYYCQSDQFVEFVGDTFGHVEGGAKIAVMRDWIESEVSYVIGSSDQDTTVLDTFQTRQGVCRDYTHLICAFARAAQIPARAVAAYSPNVRPQDFHAVAQVWLDGAWHLVDATGMCNADDLAVIAVGRDAYDIAFMDSSVFAQCQRQEVRVSRI
ncbi:transglutaminase superfamily protein [Pacificibacter maritimus]|uniref:Transglutaminase superfamily protein n=1 Tax=Pacificibacter maritimus TaxID=762213 RepID=A0A3N4UUV0_9RHOB|nr:transglutaminase family protein [Pacificibacter maritimus]RPE71269.1 transglutaminase superfamily protein [Pacificibacter maritimus]